MSNTTGRQITKVLKTFEPYGKDKSDTQIEADVGFLETKLILELPLTDRSNVNLTVSMGVIKMKQLVNNCFLNEPM